MLASSRLALTAALAVVSAGVVACGSEEAPPIIEPKGPVASVTPGPHTPAVLRERLAAGTVRIATVQGNRKGGGSGIALESGDILTNAHVVEGATTLQVYFKERKVAASIVAADSCGDVAIIRPVEKLGTTPLPWAPVSAKLLDTEVWTAGFPTSLRGAGGASRKIQYSTGMVTDVNVSSNVVDPPQRGLVQFDAMLRPGNSGGVLANTRGEIVGMNTLRDVDPSGVDGPAFAIGVERLKALMPPLAAGRNPASRVGWNLLTLDADIISDVFKVNIKPYRKAILVTAVRTGTPAYKAKVRTGDLLISVEGQRVRDVGDVCEVLTSASSGDSLTVRAAREYLEGWFTDNRLMKLP